MSTRFANCTPLQAGVVIILLIAVVTYGVIYYHPILSDPQKDNIKGEDLRCYRRIVERIHSGEGYYEAAGSELRRRGYAVRSVFNWRLPFLAWLMGRLPSITVIQILAVILASMTFLAWLRILERHYAFLQIMFGSLFTLGPIIYSLLPGDVFLAHEFWAGTFITLSLGAYALGWRLLSVVSGLMALFIRELALPFAILMMGFAYIEGRRLEALSWMTGILCFGLTLLFHWSTVTNLLMQGDLAQKEGWIVFGGWKFVLSTAQLNPYLFRAPPWITALILPLVLLGITGWREQLWARLSATIGIYICAYFFVGKSFNRYWGLMYDNILLLGLLNVLPSLRDLWQATYRNLRSGLKAL